MHVCGKSRYSPTPPMTWHYAIDLLRFRRAFAETRPNRSLSALTQPGEKWPVSGESFGHRAFRTSLSTSGPERGASVFNGRRRSLLRLDALKLQTLELHWAESFIGTPSEHNVIVVTAKGQPFAQGILLDNWRYGGASCLGTRRRRPPLQMEGKQCGNGPQIENKIDPGIAGRTCTMSVRTISNNRMSKRLARYS